MEENQEGMHVWKNRVTNAKIKAQKNDALNTKQSIKKVNNRICQPTENTAHMGDIKASIT